MRDPSFNPDLHPSGDFSGKVQCFSSRHLLKASEIIMQVFFHKEYIKPLDIWMGHKGPWQNIDIWGDVQWEQAES